MSSSYPSPMLVPLVQQSLFLKRLPRLYLGALLLIATFALAGQVLIQVLLSQQADDAHVISLAANQETLSQRVSKDALAIALTADPTDRQERAHYLAQFLAVGSSWNRVHLGLQNGDPGLNLPKNTDAQMAQLFKGLEPQYQGILHAFLDVVKFTDDYKTAHPKDPVGFPAAPLAADVKEVLTQEEPFALGMQNVVSRFEALATARVTTVRLTEVALCVGTLLVLGAEAFFLFAPAVRNLKRNATDLQSAEQNLTKNAQALQERNDQIKLALGEVWAIRRKAVLPVQVVQPGQYRVLNATGDHYYTVTAGLIGLECECYVGQQTRVCSHIVAAAGMHAAIERSQRRTSSARPIHLRHA